MLTKNPTAVTRQGFGTVLQASSETQFIIPTFAHQPQIDVVQLFARRTGVAASTVRTFVELNMRGAHV